MYVNNVSSSSANSSSQPSQTGKTGFEGYGSTQFMQMLMAQLTHQNPMEPMNDSEMMNQFVQLNSLSELQSIKSAIGQVVESNQTGYAASLIGKKVKAFSEDGQAVEGIVDSVTVLNGAIQLQVGENKIPLTSVTEVTGG